MTNKHEQDNLVDSLTSLAQSEPVLGLEQTIWNRISQEPLPEESPKRVPWKTIRLSASLASFAAVLVVGIFYSLHWQGLSGNAKSKSKADMKTAASSSQGSAATNQRQLSNPALATAKEAEPVLKKGVRIQLREPSENKADATGSKLPDTFNSKSDTAEMKTMQSQTGDSTAAGSHGLTNSDLLQVVQELYAAGAEWVTINHIPVTLQDSVDWDNGAVVIRKNRLSAPYVVEVSGDPEQIQQVVYQKDSFTERLLQASRAEMTVEAVH